MAATVLNVTDATLKGSVTGPTFTGTVDGSKFTGSVTYQAATEPPPIDPPPVTGSWTPPSYLRTDTRSEVTPNVPRPAYLVPFADPKFITKITRITGDPGTSIRGISGAKWGDVARHHYSSDQAWNCNQSLIYLDTNSGSGGTGGLCLNGSNYEPAFMIKGIPSDSDVRWHATDPAVMLYAAGSKLGTWNPKTGAVTVIKNFGSSYSGCKFGPWEGSPTEDGSRVVISCNQGGFAYDIKADKKYPDISKFGTPDNVRISPLGTYILWKTDPDVVTVTDLQGTQITKIANNIISHFDTCVDQAGDEVIVGRNNGAGGGTGGQLIKIRLRDGKRTEINTGGWCSHTSARSLTRKYAVSAPTNEGGNVPPPYRGEVVMSNLDGSVTYRLCHSHEPAAIDYKAETQPSHSPDGGRVIFASAWDGGGNTPRPVGCYIADFRS